MPGMRIDRMLDRGRPIFSFEFFPPDSDEGTERLFRVIERLRTDCHPDFVSVTCRNHSRDRTLELVKRIQHDLGIDAMAHFTCAGATRVEMHRVLADLEQTGIENVLALRGDPVTGGEVVAASGEGLDHGSDLVELIRDRYAFCVGGACYPETHSEATSPEDDLRFTRLKEENGASFLITTMFFDNAAYFDFVARARGAGVTVPIIPGIMPVTSLNRLDVASSTFFGVTIPRSLCDALARRADDPDAVVQLGAAYATLQASELLAAGVPGVHLYTLNRSPATRAVLAALLAARPWERPG